eukprot:4562193-Amphidinium_carterae.1
MIWSDGEFRLKAFKSRALEFRGRLEVSASLRRVGSRSFAAAVAAADAVVAADVVDVDAARIELIAEPCNPSPSDKT